MKGWLALALSVALLPTAQAASVAILGPVVLDGGLVGTCEVVGVGGFPPQPTIDEKCIPGGPSPPPSAAEDTNSTGGNESP